MQVLDNRVESLPVVRDPVAKETRREIAADRVVDIVPAGRAAVPAPRASPRPGMGTSGPMGPSSTPDGRAARRGLTRPDSCPVCPWTQSRTLARPFHAGCRDRAARIARRASPAENRERAAGGEVVSRQQSEGRSLPRIVALEIGQHPRAQKRRQSIARIQSFQTARAVIRDARSSRASGPGARTTSKACALGDRRSAAAVGQKCEREMNVPRASWRTMRGKCRQAEGRDAAPSSRCTAHRFPRPGSKNTHAPVDWNPSTAAAPSGSGPPSAKSRRAFLPAEVHADLLVRRPLDRDRPARRAAGTRVLTEVVGVQTQAEGLPGPRCVFHFENSDYRNGCAQRPESPKAPENAGIGPAPVLLSFRAFHVRQGYIWPQTPRRARTSGHLDRDHSLGHQGRRRPLGRPRAQRLFALAVRNLRPGVRAGLCARHRARRRRSRRRILPPVPARGSPGQPPDSGAGPTHWPPPRVRRKRCSSGCWRSTRADRAAGRRKNGDARAARFPLSRDVARRDRLAQRRRRVSRPSWTSASGRIAGVITVMYYTGMTIAFGTSPGLRVVLALRQRMPSLFADQEMLNAELRMPEVSSEL